MIEQIELHLSKCTSFVQFDVNTWFVDIFDEHKEKCMFCGENIEPRHVHLTAEKHVIRNLKGTIDYELRCILEHEIRLQGYIDSDWVGSVIDRKSTF
jgi:hypothetical protein